MTLSQKIVPCLWFNGVAKEAVEFYMASFPQAKLLETTYYPTEGLLDFQESLAGKELTLDFELGGYRLTALNAGGEFQLNSSISFMLNFDPSQDSQAKQNLRALWEKLSAGGKVLMPLQEYPYSKLYGWVEDRFGVTWQLILTDPAGEPRPFLMPSLLFGSVNTNRAEEAVQFYTKVFPGSKIGNISRYPVQTGPARAGAVMFSDFTLLDQWFVAMDSGVEQDFTFTEAISLQVLCETQDEIDLYWEKLSTVPEAEQCGWCKDQFGLSWQVTPFNSAELLKRPQAFEHMLEMKKIVIADY